MTSDASYVWGPTLTGPSSTNPEVMRLGVAVALQGDPKLPGQTVESSPAVFMDVAGGDLQNGGAPRPDPVRQHQDRQSGADDRLRVPQAG